MLLIGVSSDRVNAGTIQIFVQRLANEEIQDLVYVHALLLTYRSFFDYNLFKNILIIIFFCNNLF